MNIKRIVTFLTVAELGTISAAAQRLRLTQPALSRQLQDLQVELQLVLFERIGRRLRLTSAGETLLPACRALVSQAEALSESARALTRGDRGVLRVGATSHLIAQYFPSFLHLFARAYPEVRLELVDGETTAHLDALRHGTLHCVIGRQESAEPEFQVDFLTPFYATLAWSAGLPHPPMQPVEVKALVALPLLLLRQGFYLRRAFDAVCRLENVTPRIVFESHSPGTLLALARADHGVALIGSSAVIDPSGLNVAPLYHRGIPWIFNMRLIWRQDFARPTYAIAFADMLGAHMRAVTIVPG